MASSRTSISSDSSGDPFGEAPNMLWLGDPHCADREVSGGKAAHLSRLAAAYRVPSGFCVTAAAFDRAVAAGAAGPLAGDPAAMPPHLLPELARAYHELGERCGAAEVAVAVRSSAVDEDSVSASFAGQYETYLNVRGVAAVATAVSRCWASGAALRVREYRRQHGLPEQDARLAVLIQQLVLADVSAVVFTANPLTGDRGEVIVTAAWGLGESVVGGSVTPDTYAVRKTNLGVVSRRIADKQRMTVPVPGGTAERPVPAFLRRRPVLDDAHVQEMARLAVALEEIMGWPADVECAFQAGTLYLLQCRPITALSP